MSTPPKLSLLEALSFISPEKGGQNRFMAEISPDWCTQHSILGGYLTALLLSTARKYLDKEASIKAKYPDPIHIFTQFLRPVPPGRVSISCKTLRTTSRLCVVQLELELLPQLPLQPARKPQPICTTAIATFANVTKETGLTQDTTNPAPLPNRETQCVTVDDPVVEATPITRKLHWVAPRSADGLWGHRLGGHQREVWLSFRDGTSVSDFRHLALIADLPLQPPATHQADFYSRFALSTLCLSVEFKRRPNPTTEWVLVRSNSKRVSGGRYDVHVQILNEDGDILALSNHVVYISELGNRKTNAAKI